MLRPTSGQNRAKPAQLTLQTRDICMEVNCFAIGNPKRKVPSAYVASLSQITLDLIHTIEHMCRRTVIPLFSTQPNTSLFTFLIAPLDLSGLETSIKAMDAVKYLGIYFDRKLSWEALIGHIKKNDNPNLPICIFAENQSAIRTAASSYTNVCQFLLDENFKTTSTTRTAIGYSHTLESQAMRWPMLKPNLQPDLFHPFSRLHHFPSSQLPFWKTLRSYCQINGNKDGLPTTMDVTYIGYSLLEITIHS